MKRSTRASILAAFLLFTHFTLSIAAGDSITPIQPLRDGQTIVSPSGTFELGFFKPGASNKLYVGICYHNLPRTYVWVANRDDPLVNDTGGILTIRDGRLALLNQGGGVVWSSKGATNATDPIARVQDDGNFVLTDSTGALAWQSFDYPTDTLLSGMKFGWDLKTGLNRNLTSWRSLDDPSSGDYSTYMDVHGSPQPKLFKRSTLTYRSGPWNGLYFSGIPEMKTYDKFIYEVVQNSTDVYYTCRVKQSNIITRLIVNQSGVVQRFVWLDEQQIWNLIWFGPKDPCDDYGKCGPNGLCDTDEIPLCDCLKGFERKTPKDWYLREASDGCVRKTALDCGSDGFAVISGVKVPDTSTSTVDRAMSLDECRGKCLKNCSCTAYAAADIGSGSGCVMWYGGNLTDTRSYRDGGQEIYLKLAASDLMDLPLFDLSTIVMATDNFSNANKIGEGGFGLVYKGKLEGDQEIAVKRLSRNSTQGVDEFKNEVMLIAKLQHRNLVRLLGCCTEGDERMLIYEYMPNKSLDTFLFDVIRRSCLDWRRRYNIILGIARGLVYLHQDSRFRIIHRDLKVSNILLDKEMNPKISDFGMARIFRGDHGEANTRRVVGTYGYMSPEYAMDGIFSVKSDVFSFGVLVLEIMSGKKNRGVYRSQANMNLLTHAWMLWKEGNALELLDVSMGYSSPIEAMRCIQTGLLCVQEQVEDRPMMPFVVMMLSSETIVLPQPRQPGFYNGGNHFQQDWPTDRKQESSCSANGITMTLIEAR
ncbi:Receptor-like serine/threonine-protein kinase SD1-8 [Acorus gramineus]|uniref:Receptor-like serine/threonine-protein kinase n=1 Tax=Acorus gramineus TaxID=55184 RepID=A0AAV9AAD1_ACOGR|nr:Receptor-like serine/threonine-protein kinase SD1-8 [Acorus gramineus]